MSPAFSAAERAREIVRVCTKVPAGPWFVELTAPAMPLVFLGPYQNPATAREEAKQITAFLEAVLAEATRGR